jgi:hypothetical protein
MMPASVFQPSLTGRWNLPPLILHPFAGREGPDKLLEGSRAALMLNGLMPSNLDTDELTRRILAGRHNEVRMLYFLGKDIFRWMDQCQEIVNKSEMLKTLGIRTQSFSAMLVDTPPKGVTDKLNGWGVSDQRSIFSRAIGLRSAFEELPSMELLSQVFLRNYHRYADGLYNCYQRLGPFTAINPDNFPFELYGSEEYSKKLAEQFERDEI